MIDGALVLDFLGLVEAKLQADKRGRLGGVRAAFLPAEDIPGNLSADFMLILLMTLCFVSKHFPNESEGDRHSGNPNTATI
jgi:hypothetical protein